MSLNETYSKFRMGKHLSDALHIQNGLQEDIFIVIAFQLCSRIQSNKIRLD
jgi:hypothetical protein